MGEGIVPNVLGQQLGMSEENGNHFIGPVPTQRECSGRKFVVIAIPAGGAKATTFRCLRCGRELKGIHLPENQSHLIRIGGEIP